MQSKTARAMRPTTIVNPKPNKKPIAKPKAPRETLTMVPVEPFVIPELKPEPLGAIAPGSIADVPADTVVVQLDGHLQTVPPMQARQEPPKPTPLTCVVKMPLAGYLCSKFTMIQHLMGKIDSVAAPVLPEDCQRYDMSITIEVTEARPIG